jgi:ABC-type sugar transport system substrate-binding protein
MYRLWGVVFALGLWTENAFSQELAIAVSGSERDDPSALSKALEEIATSSPQGVHLQIVNANNDAIVQEGQVRNLVQSGAKAIVVNLVDWRQGSKISEIAAAANVPIVYVQTEPENLDSLPANEVYVGADEHKAGVIYAKKICEIAKKGDDVGVDAVVVIDSPKSVTSRLRLQGIFSEVGIGNCGFLRVVQEDSTDGTTESAEQLVVNWITAGLKFDAVIATNDAMAMGAIIGLTRYGRDASVMAIGGIGAFDSARVLLTRGELDFTISQDLKRQAETAVDYAIRLARGETIPEKITYVEQQMIEKGSPE